MEIGYLLDGRYRITAFISEGSTANVYKARDEVKKRDVAIKIMKKDSVVISARYEDFMREATFLASLRHINIIRIYAFGYEADLPYLVVELAKGPTLSHLIERYGNYQEKEAISIMKQLLDAIIFTHKKGLLHRDIKPQNIFYSADGTLMISDFGIAVALQNEAISSNKVFGSVPYLAPEVIQGQPASIKSDIYALGVTFYEILTGHLPFNGDSIDEIAKKHIKAPFPSLRKESIPNCEEIDRIIRKACAKSPADRYANAKEMLDDINAIASLKKEAKVPWYKRLWRH